jgi:hypothetical protein
MWAKSRTDFGRRGCPLRVVAARWSTLIRVCSSTAARVGGASAIDDTDVGVLVDAEAGDLHMYSSSARSSAPSVAITIAHPPEFVTIFGQNNMLGEDGGAVTK